jgi:hypothetical protein
MPYFHIIGREPWNSDDDDKPTKQLYQPEPPPPISDPDQRLGYFCERGNLDEIRRCIKEYGANVNYGEYGKGQPLIRASAAGQTKTVIALVKEFGASISATNGWAVNCAVGSGRLETLKVLVNDLGSSVYEGHAENAYYLALQNRHDSETHLKIFQFLEKARESSPQRSGTKKRSLFQSLFY